MRCDVGEEAEIKAAVARTVEAFGTIDIAVNNAIELATAARTVLDTSSEDFHRQMVTGPLAALTMMKAVFPLMEGRDGRILNFGSAADFQGTVGMTPYKDRKSTRLNSSH